MGDLNVHLVVPEDPETRQLMAIIETLSLVQHAVGLTHNRGYTLNVAISRDTLKDVKVLDQISDHSLIACYPDYSKPKPVKQTVTSRKLRDPSIFRISRRTLGPLNWLFVQLPMFALWLKGIKYLLNF